MKVARIRTPDNQVVYAVPTDDGKFLRLDGDLFRGLSITSIEVVSESLLAPLVPSSILCIGLNYLRHAAEGGMTIPSHPILFMKLPTSAIGSGQPIVLPNAMRSDHVDFECELAVIIGRSCKNVAADEALDYVLGYTCANDVSARDWQMHGGGHQWCRGKTFDTFCPLGPHIVTADEINDPQQLRIRTLVNGAVMQDWTTGDMIFDVAKLISFLSGSTTLAAGTVILTGTPHGVGFARRPPVYLQAGDVVTVEIEGIGKLTNPVLREDAVTAFLPPHA